MTMASKVPNAGANSERAVLVTGAGSGIGRKITERLVADGFFVYGGVRKDAAFHALGTIKNVQPLHLDVTNSQDIAAAVDAVVKGGRGLYGLVNNAGVGTFGPIVSGNDEEFDLVMAVNVYGPYRITKAFASLIVAERGRIVTIGSVSGILAGKNFGAYCMSKHAVEAFADSLALEMEPFGVRVSVLEPGRFNTEIAKNMSRRLGADPKLVDLSESSDPDVVAGVVALAMVEPEPKRRYLVVSSVDEAKGTIEKQIEVLVQLNEGHTFSFDRHALVNMLDAALAGLHPRESSLVQRDVSPPVS